ncbi:MAG: von Willebrand factor type A domain-containing protein [Flavobacterium sp.]|nr:von Willebrand factor type A domain-containing protein [Flavobacterium sp.]
MKNVKMFSSAIAMLLFFATTAYSQADIFTISGTVSDQSGVLPGANVQVKNTNRITQTDIYGMYSIKAHKNEKLVFSFVGMASQEVTVTKSAVVNIILNTENFLLQEVVQEPRVVMGSLGIKRERSATSSSQIPVQGKASGLAVAHDKDHPRIVLRGNSSLQGGNQALIVIDNKIATAEQLKKLKPEEIQSTHVIKGAQGAALYGSDGVNGVITVTTKAAFAQGIQPYTPTQEDYESFVENPFESPKNAPLSTFSIDVDNASYTNIRRMINNGQKIPKDAVRVEEMVNFFKYDYPKPIGGHPFSINTEASDSPWNPKHKLLKIGLQGKILPTNDLPASNLVFLIDVSGSMNSANKLPLLVQSFKILLNELRTEDKVSIIVYAGAAGMVLPPTSGSEKQTIIAALDRLSAGGSTAGGAGIELAYKTAQENFIKGGNNRVILATDGDFNVGSTSNSDMQSLIETKRKSGVFLTCLGYGMGNYKDSKMEILANKGNGNYAYIDNIQEANRFLSKEFKGSMFAIAKDVKIQIEFNPKHVQSYRLIGYENRKLRAEDFIDDSIDAGELGSGHTVTALYEIIPVGVESEFTKDIPELKYTDNKTKSGNFNDELATIKFRYKKPDGEKSIEMIETIAHKFTSVQAASADLKFSAAVAWFGLKLRDSKLVGNKEVADIKNLAKTGIKNDPEGYRSEFIRLLETAI